MKKTMKKSIKKERMRNLIRDYKHPAYSYELELLKNIRSGKMDESYEAMAHINELERATLSSKPLHSKKYSLIIWCSLFTREAISAGVDFENAFALSDVLINTIDKKSTMKEIEAFEFLMIDAFIDLIHSYGTRHYPYPVSKIVKYIQVNITEKLTVKSLAETFNMHPDYLSSKFKQEVGVPLTWYIQSTKVNEAKNLLANSDNSITEIASILNFGGSSYFSRVFRKHTQMSPGDFRDKAAFEED